MDVIRIVERLLPLCFSLLIYCVTRINQLQSDTQTRNQYDLQYRHIRCIVNDKNKLLDRTDFLHSKSATLLWNIPSRDFWLIHGCCWGFYLQNDEFFEHLLKKYLFTGISLASVSHAFGPKCKAFVTYLLRVWKHLTFNKRVRQSVRNRLASKRVRQSVRNRLAFKRVRQSVRNRLGKRS